MRLRSLLILVAAATIVLLSVSATAAAHGSSHLVAHFHVKGGSGPYRINVAAWRAPPLGLAKPTHHHRGKVTVSVHDNHTETTYTTRARFNRRRIRADLGHYGRIALNFRKNPGHVTVPSGTAQKRDVICGQSGTRAIGQFRGVFRFRGEDGYVEAKAHKIRGNVGRNGPRQCEAREHGIELVARSGSTKFAALDEPDLGATFLLASTEERVGAVQVHRLAARATAPDSGEFTFDSALTHAHVAPAGRPFTGTADFSPSSWTGTLAVSFAGEGNVPLTGPSFSANLKPAGFDKRALTPSR